MIIFRQIAPMKKWLEARKSVGDSIGFVPTMGALHEGHLSLVARSLHETEVTVCSIFVNPTQFNDPADFERYPATPEADILQLAGKGVHALFLPSVSEMYPDGASRQKHYDLGFLETVFEGAFRPGHFQGVCQAVHRLLDIVTPHFIFMGQKDYQQCMVVQRLLETEHIPAELVICETMRAPSGLALSSRNMRLSEEEKNAAAAIWNTMRFLKDNIQMFNEEVESRAHGMLKEAGFDKIDYCVPAHAHTLGPFQPGGPAVIVCAAFLGNVRLIDNLLL